MCNALVLKYEYVDSIQLKSIRTVYLKERINLPPILACVNWEDQIPRIRDETDLGHGGSWYYCPFLFLLEILPKNKQTKKLFKWIRAHKHFFILIHSHASSWKG